MPAASPAVVRPPRFAKDSAFRRDLDAGFAAYFAHSGMPERDIPAMYAKTAIIWGWFWASWAALVFAPIRSIAGPLTVPVYLLLAVSLGLAIGGIGMSVMHDANHGAYSRKPWVNKLVGWSLDALGCSSFIWRTKHNAVHHTWTNVEGCDDDIAMQPLARMAPSQPYRSWHRVQHLYMWPLYGLLHFKWFLLDDFRDLRAGRVAVGKLPKREAGFYLTLVLSKLSYIALAFAVPIALHNALPALGLWLVATMTTGLTLAVTFQLAHCVGAAEFPVAVEGKPLERDWAEHQLATTVDFAPGNKLATWFMGGLNYQVVHHLAPKVCHLHYPSLAKIVAETAQKHGLQYRTYPTTRAAIAAHCRFLRYLAQPQTVLTGDAKAESADASVPLATLPAAPA